MSWVVGKKPIDLTTLERVLLLLNDLPGISGSGVLRQGDKLGASELIVTLNNLPPKTYSVTVNNGASKTMVIFMCHEYQLSGQKIILNSIKIFQ